MSVPFNGVDMVFLHKIHSTVLQALLPVDGEGELSRDRRLHALFNDLTCRIDLEVRHHFKNDAPIASRYYLMMSHYYLEFPEKAEEVLQHSLHLWNTLHMPLIFALLFHEYLFIKCANSQEYSIKRMGSFVKGLNKLFWLDLENSSKRFAYIWMFLFKGVLLAPERWNCLLSRRYLDVFDLVAKFYFYYHGDRDLELFVDSMKAAFSHNKLDTPQDHTKLVPLNMFCNEVVRTMKLMKNEEVLRQYLVCCRCFGKSELKVTGQKTLLRLGDLLSDLATPGYPLYPTPEVKEEAKLTLNLLWPYGAFLRELIRFSFRLLRPLSFLTWIQFRGAQLRSLLAHIWLWIVGTVVWLLSFIPFASAVTLGRSKQARQDAIAEAKRHQQIVRHLGQEARGTDSKRRVRFKLPEDEEDKEVSSSPPDEPEIRPPTNRAQSPLRSPTRRRRAVSEEPHLDESGDNLFIPSESQPSSHISGSHDAHHLDNNDNDEEEEDIDDIIDDAELEKYVKYSAGYVQSPALQETF